ncbi:hypothetical protein [Dactylosporangium sp. CA-092794]
MTNLIARLRARALSGDRGAATVNLGLAAILLGVTALAALSLIGGDLATW